VTETAAPHLLDNAGWAALTSHHESFAETKGDARRYPVDVSPFAAVDRIDDERLVDLAALSGSDGPFALMRGEIPALPAGWDELHRGRGHQLTVTVDAYVAAPRPDVRRLTVDDVPQMLDLVAVTEPGPFRPRTIEMGRYYGHFDGARLVAMAGERLHLDGFTEISAVCTHPDARGRGLASGITGVVAEGIFERGEQPFLHVAENNAGALRVYEGLGFVRRRWVEFALIQASIGEP